MWEKWVCNPPMRGIGWRAFPSQKIETGKICAFKPVCSFNFERMSEVDERRREAETSSRWGSHASGGKDMPAFPLTRGELQTWRGEVVRLV
jgi:hypothetical protein